MIANIVIIVATLLLLMASASVVYQSYLDTRLEYIDKLIARGANPEDLFKGECK